jgi:hypothetical protein
LLDIEALGSRIVVQKSKEVSRILRSFPHRKKPPSGSIIMSASAVCNNDRQSNASCVLQETTPDHGTEQMQAITGAPSNQIYVAIHQAFPMISGLAVHAPWHIVHEYKQQKLHEVHDESQIVGSSEMCYKRQLQTIARNKCR